MKLRGRRLVPDTCHIPLDFALMCDVFRKASRNLIGVGMQT